MEDNQSEDSMKVQAEWMLLPENVLIKILKYLSVKTILNCGETCARWNVITNDSSLWKYKFHHDYKVEKKVDRKPGSNSWLSEYQRLYNNVPIVLTDVLSQHTGPVEHVAFSNNGEMFSTCSSDGLIILWTTNDPISVKHKLDVTTLNIRTLHMEYPFESQFNESDFLILVFVYTCRDLDYGEILIFSIDDFGLKCRVKSFCDEVICCWFDDHHIISGLRLRNNLNNNGTSQCVVRKINATQSDLDGYATSVSELFTFTYRYRSSWCLRKLKSFDGDNDSKFFVFQEEGMPDYPHQIKIKKIVVTDGIVDETETLFDFKGCVLAMQMSPDQRFLYVNMKTWPADYVLCYPFEAPPSPSAIAIQVIDLVLMTMCETKCQGPESFVQGHHFAYLNVSQNFLALASDEGPAFIWDRHYEVCLGMFQHSNEGINAIAFHPKDEQMAITVGFDRKIKIWRSRAKVKNSGIQIKHFAKEENCGMIGK